MATKIIQISRALLKSIPFRFRDRVRNIPGVAGLQRTLLARMLDGREFEHTVDAGPAKGITFLVTMPDDKGIWTGTYELEFASRVAAAVRPGTVTYDIGSWHGFFAGVMAAQGARTVHVFEPLPSNARRIAKLVTLNPEKEIRLHACAVGEADGEVDLIIMPETSMAKLVTSKFQSNRTAAERVRVPARSIDALVAAGEIEPPALMKIDVEGAEGLVLLGARETILRHRPEIFAEIHSPALLRECRDILSSAGYCVTTIQSGSSAELTEDVFQVEAQPVS